MKQISNSSAVTRLLVITVDLIVVNILYGLFADAGRIPANNHSQFLWNVAYVIAVYCITPMAHMRLAKGEVVVSRCFWTALLMMAVFVIEQSYVGMFSLNWHGILISGLCTFLFLTLFRFASRVVIKYIRSHGRDRNNEEIIRKENKIRKQKKKMASDKNKK